MAFVGIDLGTNLGWAIGERGQVVQSGTISFQMKRFEGGGMRFLRFEKFLNDLKENSSDKLQGVFFEEVKARQPSAAADQIYGGFKATLMAWCDRHEIPYQGLPVGSIKKFATGKGNANKDAMIFAAEMLGFDPASDDEADAIHILRYAMTEIVPQ